MAFLFTLFLFYTVAEKNNTPLQTTELKKKEEWKKNSS